MWKFLPKSAMVVKELPKKMMLQRKLIYLKDTHAKQTTKDHHHRWRRRVSKESFPEVKQPDNYNTLSILVMVTAKPILKLSISMIMFKWEKKDCVGHLQKRVGIALRKLKKENKGIGGKGKLTNALIDKLQNYYGIAVRSNCGNLEGIEATIYANIFHLPYQKSEIFIVGALMVRTGGAALNKTRQIILNYISLDLVFQITLLP